MPLDSDHSLKHKNILVAAMDWGLGHATRCVPIIRNLQKEGHNIILASHGQSLDFLKKYFPELLVISKPGYQIKYSEKISMATAMALQAPSIARTIYSEHAWLKEIIKTHAITKVFSDNCYGLWNKSVHSVIISHQLSLVFPSALKLPGALVNRIIHYFLKKFDEIYIPDIADPDNYSGMLSAASHKFRHSKFIGTLSRFSDNNSQLNAEIFDLVVMLSGPEPQRTLLEEKCQRILAGRGLKCCFLRGLPGAQEVKMNTNEFTWHNHLDDDLLKAILKNARKIICRSGYSTIMDLIALDVRALFIPTPGQTEQEYLAAHNSGKQFEFIKQEEMDFEKIKIGNPEKNFRASEVTAYSE